MANLRDKILAGTSKPASAPAYLVLADGTVYKGNYCTVEGEVRGLLAVDTSMIGYTEAITDPAREGELLVMTYPQIGNYGMCKEDFKAPEPALAGLVVRDLCTHPSSFRSEMSVPDFLKEKGVVAIEDVDTRALVRRLEKTGPQRGAIVAGGDFAAIAASLREESVEKEAANA